MLIAVKPGKLDTASASFLCIDTDLVLTGGLNSTIHREVSGANRNATQEKGLPHMAHELEIVSGVARMAYVGKTPWHSLGQKISADATAEEWLKAAGLDWTVSTRDVFLAGHDKPIKDFRALVRDDDEKVLDMVGNDWEPIQNYQAMKFFERFCKAGALSLETAGSLRGGRDVWVLAKATEAFDLPGGDQVCSYVLFDNPHQRGRAALIIPTPIRVVCANTQGWALAKHDAQAKRLEARFTHVGEGRFSEDSAIDQLAIIGANFKAFEEMARFLATRRCKAQDFETYIERVYGLTDPAPGSDERTVRNRMAHNARIVDALKTICESQPGAGMSEGSFWSAYNAVTYDVDHSPRREVGADRTVGSAWLGAGRDRKAKALHVAVEMAG